MIEKQQIIKDTIEDRLYPKITEEYLKEYQGLFKINMEKCIMDIYFALYKVAMNVHENDDVNTVVAMVEKSFSSLKYAPQIGVIVSHIEQYYKEDVSINDILLSHRLMNYILFNEFKSTLVILKNKYKEDYQFILDLVNNLEKSTISNIPKFERLDSSVNRHVIANSVLERNCFSSKTRHYIDNCSKDAIFPEVWDSAKLFHSKGKNVSVKYYLSVSRNAPERTALQLRFDEMVFNAIHTIYMQSKSTFISLPEIWRNISGERKTLTAIQRNHLLESIFYMNTYVDCIFDMSEVYKEKDSLYDNCIRDGINEFLDIVYNKYNSFIISQKLLEIDIMLLNFNDALLIDGITVRKLSIAYLLTFYMKQTVGVSLSMFECIEKEDTQRLKYIKSAASLPIICYTCKYIETNFGKKQKSGERTMCMETLYAEMGMCGTKGQTQRERDVLKKERHKTFDIVKIVFSSLKKSGFIKEWRIEEDKSRTNKKVIFKKDNRKTKITKSIIKNEADSDKALSKAA